MKRRKYVVSVSAFLLAVLMCVSCLGLGAGPAAAQEEAAYELMTNLDGWEGRNFGKKENYGEYGVSGELVSNADFNWTYSTSDTAPDGTKSFSFDVIFTLYGAGKSDGAQQGWADAAVVLGSKSRTDVQTQSAMFSLNHRDEANQADSVFRMKINNEVKQSVPMTAEQYGADTYRMYFTYNAETETLAVLLDGESAFTVENAKELVSGYLGFAAVFNTMKVTRAVYREEKDLETNLNGWNGLNFTERKDYGTYQVSGSLVAGLAYDWAVGSYTTADLALDGTKSFTLDMSFYLYDIGGSDGARQGWSEAGVLLGVKDRENVMANSTFFTLNLLPAENWSTSNFRMKVNNGSAAHQTVLTRAQYESTEFNLHFTYDAQTQKLEIRLNGALILTIEDAKETVTGGVGAAAVWNTMKLTKAVYTELPDIAETGSACTPILIAAAAALICCLLPDLRRRARS